MKTFDEFIVNEATENDDMRLVDFFASLNRNYQTELPFYTDFLQFDVKEEKKDWRRTIDSIEFQKDVVTDAKYKLVFRMDEKDYILNVNFSFTTCGQHEKDAPEKLSTENEERLTIVLKGMKINTISIKSSEYDIDLKGSQMTLPVRTACEEFMKKMMKTEYDILDADLYKFQ